MMSHHSEQDLRSRRSLLCGVEHLLHVWSVGFVGDEFEIFVECVTRRGHDRRRRNRVAYWAQANEWARESRNGKFLIVITCLWSWLSALPSACVARRQSACGLRGSRPASSFFCP